ncbi:hypothetical protein [Actinokineospora enzanensis]|uniref:hypothetical protein n=1 Tax=Actinokineospora enzanensis TaxID=155975 RepID=UPI0012EC141D|nr:hypothetical protein [Actinokineospora enzanensis]
MIEVYVTIPANTHMAYELDHEYAKLAFDQEPHQVIVCADKEGLDALERLIRDARAAFVDLQKGGSIKRDDPDIAQS